MVTVFVTVQKDDGSIEDLEGIELHFLPRYKDEICIPGPYGFRPRVFEVQGVRQIVGPSIIPTVFCRELDIAEQRKDDRQAGNGA